MQARKKARSRRKTATGQAAATPHKPLSPRERGKQLTREALLDAALAVFSAEGLDAPSLDAICERAGCTRGAFYVHFRDRDDLIAATMERRRGDVVRSLLGSPSMTLVTILRTFAQAVEAGQFPVPGAVRTGELLAACRRSPTIRATEIRLLHETLARVDERVRRDQSAGLAPAHVDSGGLALVLLLVEAGAELFFDLGFPLDVRAGVTALEGLLAGPPRHE